MSRKPDYAHRLTDRELAALERRISAIYQEARDGLDETVRAYFESFRKRDEEMKKLIGTIQNGREWTEQDYINWRLAQIGRGERFKSLRDKVAERMTKANETATAYVNDATPGIYSLNRNYAAYTIEQVAGDVGFDLWDEQTVKRLIVEQPGLMPYYPPKRALRRGIDLAWGKKQITASVTSSILQGKSIKGMADDLQTRIPEMNRASAIRTARTAVTGAQNAGRMDSYHAAEKMGIRMKKEWLATLDNRTRHAHAMLDGQKADVDEPFKVGSEEIRYPGDPTAAGHLVYNCFVGETQIASDSGIVRSYKHRYDGDLIEVETARGVNFTCTPNHPILTPHGWVRAASLHNGDDLLVTFKGNAGAFRRYGNIEHIHSSMKALYNAFHRFGLVSRDSTLRINFHSDIPTANVEVIAKEWKLRSNRDSGGRNCINKFLLKNPNKPLVSQRPFVEHFWRVCKPAFRLVRCAGKTLSFLWCGLGHAGIHGFRAVTGSDIGVSQHAVNHLTAETKIGGEFLCGFSGEIAADKIVNVKIIPSRSTHVYNLQTKNGYYFVNSSIAQNGERRNGIFAIAHNCRCTLVAAVDGVDTSDALRRDEYGPLPNMTFAQWEKQKRGEGYLQK